MPIPIPVSSPTPPFELELEHVTSKKRAIFVTVPSLMFRGTDGSAKLAPCSCTTEGAAPSCRAAPVGVSLLIWGGAVPSKKVKGSAALTTLSLWGNNIGSQGAIAIANVLKSENAVLKKMDVRGNLLNDTGSQVLRNSVKDREGFELCV